MPSEVIKPNSIKLGSRKYRIFLPLLVSLSAFVMSYFQIYGESRDYFNYEIFFELVRFENFKIFEVSRFEPGFSLASVLLSFVFTSNMTVYAWIVSIAVLLKAQLIKVYYFKKKIFFIVSVFYLARYFPLHELTQLRVAVAISLTLIGAMFLWHGKAFIAILCFAMALAFHMSTAAIIPALFLYSAKRWKAVLIALGVFAGVSLFVSFITGYLAVFIRIVEVYQSGSFGEEKPNPLAAALMLDWVMILWALFIWNRLTQLMKRVVLLELIGMAVFYGGIEFAIIAHRLREFFSVFWVFFVADGLRQNGTKLMTYGFVFVSSVFYFYLYLISGNFFQ
jgi:hypothetical protein